VNFRAYDILISGNRLKGKEEQYMMEQLEKPIILIVDDTPENIEILSIIFEDDYKVKAALNGEKALKIASMDKQPDLLLLDVVMPGMDGYEVCRRLKQNKNTQKIPVIFITANSDENDIIKAFEVGAADYITKPVNQEVVEARVRTHVELKLLRERMDELLETHVR